MQVFDERSRTLQCPVVAAIPTSRLAPFGNVSIWGAPATVDMQKLVLKEVDLRGTIAYGRDHPAVVRTVQEGKVDLKPFVTGRIALEDLVEQGFDTLINHKDTAVTVLVHP